MARTCDRQVQFGVRCREDAESDGKCVLHQAMGAPRASEPTVVLMKFKLFGSALHAAAGLFKYVPRMAEDIESAHELVAKAAGLQFRGVRATDKGPGDSGTPVFGKQGLKDVAVASLRQELVDEGFVLADVHVFEKLDGSGMLVLGYHKHGKPTKLDNDQQKFIDRSWAMNWSHCHVWANIPQQVAVADGVRFKFMLLGVQGAQLLIQVTRPRMEETALVSKKDIKLEGTETVHTVNLVGPSSKSPIVPLAYAGGLWDAK